MSDYLRRILQSFSWLKQPYQWLLVLGLLGFAVALGISAYRDPAHLDLVIGGNDGQFIRNSNGGFISPDNGLRWLRGHSVISIAGLSSKHPYTLSMFIGGDGSIKSRADYTIIVNGYRYPALPIISPRWQTWRIEKGLVKDGKLDIVFSSPTRLNVVWEFGLLLSNLKLTPATDAGQTLAEYAELDWRNVAYLTAIALLTYSFFAAARRRWLVLFGLLVSIILAAMLAHLLATNRPLFVVYASSIAIGLLLLRLAWPLLRGSIGQPRLVLWLFLLALATALLFALPEIENQDNYYKYLTAESLMLRGTPQLPSPLLDLGNSYSRYALGHSIADLPLLALGWAVEQMIGAPPLIRQTFVSLLDPILSALGVALLFLCARRLFASERLAVALSLIYFFATFALVYAVQDWTEPLLTTLTLLAFYSMLRVFATAALDRLKWLLVAGFALGYMIFSKEEYLLVAAIFGLWWLLRRGSELRGAATAWRGVTATLFFEGLRLAAPVAAFYSLDLTYNFIRSGSLFGSIYGNVIGFNHPLLVGLYGLLFSTGKGLIVFAPPVLLCLWAAAKFWRRYRWEAGLVGALFSILLVFYSIFTYWDGGNSWGPRFLLPFLPLLILVSGAALQSWAHWRVLQRWAYAGLVAAGALISVPGMLTPYWGSWIYGYQNQGLIIWGELSNFSPSYSPIAHAWEMVGRGYFESFAMFQLSYYNFPSIADHLVPGLLIALIGTAALQVGRIYVARSTPFADIADNAARLAQVAHVEAAAAS